MKNIIQKFYLPHEILQGFSLKKHSFLSEKDLQDDRRGLIATMTLLLFLTACNTDNISYDYPQDPKTKRLQRSGQYFGDDIVVFGKKNKKQQNQITSQADEFVNGDLRNITSNNPLFDRAVKITNNIIPVEIADANSGIITTIWQDDHNNQTRTKLHINAKDTKNLNVIVFKQKLVNNIWKNIQTDNQLFINTLKNQILN